MDVHLIFVFIAQQNIKKKKKVQQNSYVTVVGLMKAFEVGVCV